MIQEITDPMQAEILSRIDAVANKLGIVAEQLWEVMITQAVISGYSTLITASFFFFTPLCVLFYIRNKTFIRKHKDYYGNITETVTAEGGGAIICATIMFLTLMILSIGSENVIGKIINPEYAAFHNLMRVLR